MVRISRHTFSICDHGFVFGIQRQTIRYIDACRKSDSHRVLGPEPNISGNRIAQDTGGPSQDAAAQLQHSALASRTYSILIRTFAMFRIHLFCASYGDADCQLLSMKQIRPYPSFWNPLVATAVITREHQSRNCSIQNQKRLPLVPHENQYDNQEHLHHQSEILFGCSCAQRKRIMVSLQIPRQTYRASIPENSICIPTSCLESCA